MRILQVSHYMPPHHGGIERVAESLAVGLATRGHEVRWAASSSPLPPGSDSNRERLVASNLLERTIGLPYPLFHPAAMSELRRLVAWADVVLVHDCLYMSSAAATFAARRERRPVLLVQHVGYVPYGAVLDRVQRAAYRTLGASTLRAVDARVAVSPHVAEFFESIGVSEPFDVIPNGIDDALFRPRSEGERAAIRERLGLPHDRRIVLFAGRLVAKKGIVRVIEAMKALDRPDFVLVVAGDGPERRAAEGTGAILLGAVAPDAMPDVYACADVLVLPSVGEGFPLTIQEGRMCGLATVVSTDPTYRANLEDRPGAYLVGDRDSLARSIVKAVEEGGESRDSIARDARASWGLAQFVDSYEAILRRLVKRETSRPERSAR